MATGKHARSNAPDDPNSPGATGASPDDALANEVFVSQNSEDALEDADGTVVRNYRNFGDRAVSLDQAQLPQDAPGDRGSRRAGRAVLALVIVVVVVAVITAAATYGAELWGGKTVPLVTGTTQAQATVRLKEKGFSVRVRTQASDKTEGTVVSVSPKAGERAEAGSTVTITVAQRRVVPALTGKTLAEARSALRKAGAKSIDIACVASDATEGTVVSTNPAAGEAFASGDTVTVTVAQSFTVPYVVGKSEDDATQAVKDAGLTPSVSYVESQKDAGTIIAADPAPGTKIGRGATVTLQVSAPWPSDYHHLREYFGYTRHLTEYLQKQGFALQSSYADDENRAQALYTSADKGNIKLGTTPFSHNFPEQDASAASGGSSDANSGGAEGSDALANGASLDGVRLDLAPADVPADASSLSEVAVDEVAKLCGLTNRSEVVTSENAVVPSDLTPTSATFVCGYGEMDDYCWTVLIVNDGATRVAVTCAPKSLYDGIDLSGFGGSICDMAACVDAYE